MAERSPDRGTPLADIKQMEESGWVEEISWEEKREQLCRQLSKRLLDGVARAHGVLLLQTEEAYRNPITLLELYWAASQRKPLICLRLEGSDCGSPPLNPGAAACSPLRAAVSPCPHRARNPAVG